MRLTLQHARRYTARQRGRIQAPGWYIALSVSGLEYSKLLFPDGSLLRNAQDSSLSLTPPGFITDFSYLSNRENFVLICDIPDMRWQKDHPNFFLDDGRETVTFTGQLLLSREKIFTLRTIFERIISLKKAPTPGNLFMAEQLACSLLGELAVHEVSQTGSAARPSPGELLKNAIDKDESFSHTLQEHAEKLNYSAEYIRRCFCRLYNIDPQEYRMRRKLERIMQLLADQSLGAKEIANSVGMKNVTHLHSFVRLRCGISLKQLTQRILFPDNAD